MHTNARNSFAEAIGQTKPTPAFVAEMRHLNQETASCPLGRSTPAGVLRFLFDRVNELDASELEFLSQSNELAGHMAMNLASVVSGIGSLVAWDDQAGNFRDDGDSVSDLLFTIANQIEVIGELSNIGFEASTLLRMKGGADVTECDTPVGGCHNG